MWLLVSLDRVKTVLRIETSEDDEMLRIIISAASRAVHRYLKGQAGALLGIDSPPNSPPDDLDEVPEDVEMAVIAMAGILYRNPDGDAAKNFAEYGGLPNVVTALLYPLRDPTMA